MNNATKATVSAVGALMGVAGIEHGIGEILQGNVAPAGLMFPSWPNAAFFRIVAGEPAMSIIPNLLVTGLLSIVFSVSYLLWATVLVQRKNSGLALILLSIAMLLAGGGIFPPVLGAMIGVLGTKVNSPLSWWRTHLSAGSRRFLGKLWLWFFVACVIGWLALFPGINFFGYFFGVDDPTLTVILIIFAFGSLLLTILTGFARDSLHQEMEKAS
jgi:hypothetical protein